MLNASLQSHAERITGTEKEVEVIHSRLNNMGRSITSTTEKMRTSEADRTKLHNRVHRVEERLQGQFGRSLQTVVGIVAILGFLLSLSNSF